MSPERRLHFYEVLAHQLTVVARMIWSDDALDDTGKIAQLKWLNEILHGVTAKGVRAPVAGPGVDRRRLAPCDGGVDRTRPRTRPARRVGDPTELCDRGRLVGEPWPQFVAREGVGG